jgi:hypothetical protein
MTYGDDEYAEVRRLFSSMAAALGARDIPDTVWEPDRTPNVFTKAANYFVAEIRAAKLNVLEHTDPDLAYVQLIADEVQRARNLGKENVEEKLAEQIGRALQKGARICVAAKRFRDTADWLRSEADHTFDDMNDALRGAHREARHLTYELPEITLSTQLLEVGQTRAVEAMAILIEGPAGGDETRKEIA